MSLDASLWSVRELFLGALEREDAAEREAFLDEACGLDSERRREVEQLLAVRDEGLSSPLDDAVACFVPTELHAGAGESQPVADLTTAPLIGPYKLREQIGEGGFGVVYVAEQTQPVQRKVALKIIKPGMDTQEIIARFAAEKQALAMMDHPHIAKVFDAGTTDTGRPYFVMELIRGMPITKYCREKKCDLREQLKLFMDVCRAVQHAHQKGIIHRDLKPSNILITLHDGVPVVKVIDFGVAKALHQKLTERTIYTRHAQMIGTPMYMSPEQAELSGLDIDTRSDVYSLGVLLYELLTGTPPFDQESLMSKGFDEMRRIIREDDPPRPSHRISTLDAAAQSTLQLERGLDPRQFSHSLKRELDWVVMKALEKNRERRYESANALAADVQRYLDDEPVLACPPTVGYRLKKYLKKYSGRIATAGILVTMLIASTVVSAVFAIEAGKARDEANEQKGEAVAAKNLADERLAAEKQARQEREQERERAEHNFAAALDAVEKLLTHLGNPELAEIRELQETYEKVLHDSLAFYDGFIETHGTSPELQYRAIVILQQLAFVARNTFRFPKASEIYTKALLLADRLVQQNPDRRQFRELQAESYRIASGFYSGSWRGLPDSHETALRYSRRAETLYADLSLLEPDNMHYLEMRADCIGIRVESHYQYIPDDNYALIEKLIRQIDELTEHLPPRCKDLIRKAEVLVHREPAKAEEYIRSALAIRHLDSRQRESVCRLAAKHFSKRYPVEAEKLWLEAIDCNRRAFHKISNRINIEYSLKDSANGYARFLRNQQRNDEAKQFYTELVAEFPNSLLLHQHRAKLLSDFNNSNDLIRDATTAIQLYPNVPYYYCARCDAQDANGSVADLNKAIDLMLKSPIVERTPVEIDWFAEMLFRNEEHGGQLLTRLIQSFPEESTFYRWRGRWHSEKDQFEEARRDLNRAVDLHEGRPYPSRDALIDRATFYDKVGEFANAVDDWTVSMEIYGQPLCWNLRNRARSYFNLGDYDKALTDLRRFRQNRPDELTALSWIPIENIAACPDDAFRNGYLELANNALAKVKVQSYYTYYQTALLALEFNDLHQYQTSCRSMLEAFEDSTNPKETHFAAWACALAPKAIDDYGPAIELSQHALSENPENQQYLIGLGAILMRAGRYDEAKPELKKALNLNADANTSESYIRYFLAITEHHLGNHEVAEAQLLIANASADQEIAAVPRWNRKLTLELLRKEAEALIGKPTGLKLKPAVAVPSPGR